MKRYLLAAAVAATTAGLATPLLAADVGVSISIGDPGFYGQIDIGGYPQPQLIYPQPVVIGRLAPGRPPIYLRVPPEQAKHWKKYCRRYNACGERVYFVRDSWYQHEYMPRYQEQHRNRRDGHGDRPGDDRGRDH